MSGAAQAAQDCARDLLEAPLAFDPGAVADRAVAARTAASTTTRQRGRTGTVSWNAQLHPRGPGGRFAVSNAQQQLAAQGMYKGKVDGQHGPQTTAAVKQFQTKYGLKPTGTLTDETVATLRAPPPVTAAKAQAEERKAEAAAKPKTAKGSKGSKSKTGKGSRSRRSGSSSGSGRGGSGTAGNAWQGNLSPSGVLRPGMGGATKRNGELRRKRGDGNVRLLQAKLQALGFDLGDSGIDGRYGKATEEAVKAFQRAYGLKPDGIVGRHSKMVLNLLGHAEQLRRKSGGGLSIDQMALSAAARVAVDASRELLRP